MKVLLRFNHGLGDCVQFTSVLKHLKKYRPDWIIDVVIGRGLGKWTAISHLCNKVLLNDYEPYPGEYNKVFELKWWECSTGFEGYPSTKVERCLREVFDITPDLELLGYEVQTTSVEYKLADEYYKSIGAKEVLLLHYQGNTSTERKNLSHDIANVICKLAIANNVTPVILDWDFRSPLIDQKTIFCPDRNHPMWGGIGTGDARVIKSLIDKCKLFIGIDSGPGHIAACCSTRSLIVWSKSHPINYFAPTENITHVIPHNHEAYIHGNAFNALHTFNRLYRRVTYTNLVKTLTEMISMEIEYGEDGTILSNGFWIRRDNYKNDDHTVKEVYLDDAYKLRDNIDRIKNAKVIVDIGAHIGCFTRLVHDLNPEVKIICVEVNPENIPLLQRNVGGFAEIIHGACTYEEKELMLLNTIRPNCEGTGGSIVVPKGEENTSDLRQGGYKYRNDYRPIRKVTLEEIIDRYGIIDLLKLDCEGSEYSILENTTSLDRIKFIVGEYHVDKKWFPLKEKRFSNWYYNQLSTSSTGMGNFHLLNTNIKD